MDDALVKTLTEKIDSLPEEYISLKQQARKYLRNNSNVDKNETVNIFHRPWVAPFNWGIKLYKGAPPAWIEEVSERTGKVMPDFYGRFLSFVNGAFIYDLSLYGISSSIREKNLLDRSTLQCHDLILANTDWIQEYKVGNNYFHFGSRSYSYTENIGYFFADHKIKAIRKNGKAIKEWTDFSIFLDDEIPIVEAMMREKIPQIDTIDKMPWWKFWKPRD